MDGETEAHEVRAGGGAPYLPILCASTMSEAPLTTPYLGNGGFRVMFTLVPAPPQVGVKREPLAGKVLNQARKIYGTHRVAAVSSHHPVIQLAINFPYK